MAFESEHRFHDRVHSGEKVPIAEHLPDAQPQLRPGSAQVKRDRSAPGRGQADPQLAKRRGLEVIGTQGNKCYMQYFLIGESAAAGLCDGESDMGSLGCGGPSMKRPPPLWRSTHESDGALRPADTSWKSDNQHRPPARQATEGPVFWKWGAEAAQGQCISSGRSSLRRSLDASGDGLCVHRSGP